MKKGGLNLAFLFHMEFDRNVFSTLILGTTSEKGCKSVTAAGPLELV